MIRYTTPHILKAYSITTEEEDFHHVLYFDADAFLGIINTTSDTGRTTLRYINKKCILEVFGVEETDEEISDEISSTFPHILKESLCDY